MSSPGNAPETAGLRWSERLFVGLQFALPQHALSWLVRKATRWTWSPWKNLLIRTAIARFKIDLSDAASPDPRDYPSFNAFFTRALQPGARPIAPGEDAVVCPADGVVSQVGSIDGDEILQAKGRSYTVDALLGGDREWSARFTNGQFLTIYLSPRDYHRVHMPWAGRLVATRYVPGRLFSVDDRSTRGIDRIFARNERLICLFDSSTGPMAVILVGALMVSAIDTVWGVPERPDRAPITRSFGSAQAPELARGVEMGRFNMGSTVIVLFGAGAVRWRPNLAAGSPVRMGDRIATRG